MSNLPVYDEANPSPPVALIATFMVNTLGLTDLHAVDLYFEHEGKSLARPVYEAARHAVFLAQELKAPDADFLTVAAMAAYMESYVLAPKMRARDPHLFHALTIPSEVRSALRVLADLLNPFKN